MAQTRTCPATTILSVLALAATPSVDAQANVREAARQFDVASVKLVDHPVPAHGVGLNIKHGTLTMDAAALRQIIGLAYGIQRVRVEGGPDWLDRNCYDIVAKAESQDATRDEIREMLQALLAERFKFAFHRETRPLPVYTLVVSSNGSKLQVAKEDERTDVSYEAASGKLQLSMVKQPMATLVNLPANTLRSPVLDQTGLTATYDFKLEYAPDLPPRPDGKPPLLNGAPVDSGPSLFTALQEQLGLRLVEKKSPVEVMVVDHAERASEN